MQQNFEAGDAATKTPLPFGLQESTADRGEFEGEMRPLDRAESMLEKESGFATMAPERAARADAQQLIRREGAAAQESRAKTEAEMARRERVVAAAEAARKQLAVDQERITAEQALIRHARAAIERE